MADTSLHIPDLVSNNKWKDYRKEIWGDSFSWAWNRTTTEIKYLVIHHSVTDHNASPDYIAQLHKSRDWGGIGYHFIITKDGIVWYVGDVSTARANVKDMNEKVIGICLVGDFTQYNPSDEQICSAHDLCKFFISQANWPNLKDWDDVVGHKELQATACPGTYWKGVDDSMYERIKNRIPYTPQTPPVDWKKKFEDIDEKYSELVKKYEKGEKKWAAAEKTININNDWKMKMAQELNTGADWPKILEQIAWEEDEIERLGDYESFASLFGTKINELLGRDFKIPDEKDSLLASLDEYMSLEGERKQEVGDLKVKLEKLEKAKRPVDKLEWHELLLLAIRKLVPFINEGGDS